MLFFVYLSSALRVWMSPGTQSVFIESSYCVCVTVDMPALMRVSVALWYVCVTLSTSLWAPLWGTAIVSMSLTICAGKSL